MATRARPPVPPGSFPDFQIPNDLLQFLPASYRRRAKDPFVLPISILPLAASAVSPNSLTVSADSDLVILQQVRDVRLSADGTTIVPNPPLTVSITDTGSNRQFASGEVAIENWFGTAQLPYRWPTPKLVRGGSALTVTVTNLSAAVGYNVRLAFIGFKVFQFEQGDD